MLIVPVHAAKQNSANELEDFRGCNETDSRRKLFFFNAVHCHINHTMYNELYDSIIVKQSTNGSSYCGGFWFKFASIPILMSLCDIRD